MKVMAKFLLTLMLLPLVLVYFSSFAKASELLPSFTGRTGHLTMPFTKVDEQPSNLYRLEMSCNLFTYDCHIDSIIHLCDGFSPSLPECANALSSEPEQ